MSYDKETLEGLNKDAAEMMARYPQPRSALLPMLHLVQSVDGFISPEGINFCAQTLGLTSTEVSAVATFYTQFKRHPNGTYTLGVCVTSLCAIMGGDVIWDHLSEYLGIGEDETTSDGMFTLEKIECNAACDYAPVVMANWEFLDNQTPTSVVELVEKLRKGEAVAPSRGPDHIPTFKENERLLAGFLDDHANEGPSAGEPSLVGLKLAQEKGWKAPTLEQAAQVKAEREKAAAEAAAAAEKGEAK